MREHARRGMLTTLPLPPEENHFMPAAASLVFLLLNSLLAAAHVQCALPPVGN